MTIPTQEQYEDREITMFFKKIEDVKRLPIAERRENRERMLDHLSGDLKHFGDSVSWLIEGSYGFGAQLKAKQALENKRFNRRAWLFNHVALIEYQIDSSMASRVWNSLAKEAQDQINMCLDDVIFDWEALQKEFKDNQD